MSDQEFNSMLTVILERRAAYRKATLKVTRQAATKSKAAAHKDLKAKRKASRRSRTP